MTIRHALAWSYIGQIGNVAILFALSVVIARLLTPFEVGVYFAAAAVAGILSAIFTTGLQAYIVRESDLDKQKISTAFTVNLLLSLVLSAVVALLGLVSANWGSEHALAPVLLVLALRPLLFILEFQPTALLQREMGFKVLGFGVLASATTNFGVTILCAITGFGAMSLSLGLIAGSLAQITVFLVVSRQHMRFSLSLVGWREITRFATRIVMVSGLPTIVRRICEIIVGTLLGLAALGIFTRATNISDSLFSNIYGASTRVVFSHLSNTQRRTGELRPTFLTSFEALLTIFLPAVAGIGVLSGPLIYMLYGAKWLAAAPVLTVLMIGQGFALLFALNWEIFVLRDRTGSQVRYEGWRALTSIFGFAIGAPFGLVGASCGRLADAIIGAVIYIPRIKRIVPLHYGDLSRVYGRVARSTLAAIFPTIILMMYNNWNPETSILPILFSISLGIFLWAVIIIIDGRDVFKELCNTWKNIKISI